MNYAMNNQLVQSTCLKENPPKNNQPSSLLPGNKKIPTYIGHLRYLANVAMSYLARIV